MDRKLRSARNRIRSLKEYLSFSTRGLNELGSSQNKSDLNFQSSKNINFSVSLYDLKLVQSPPPLSSSSIYPNSSVSMYGLSSAHQVTHLHNDNENIDNKVPETVKNPAVRLFNTIKSKFRRKRRESNKVPVPKSTSSNFNPCERECSNDESPYSKSAHDITSLLHQEDSFNTPLSYRPHLPPPIKNISPPLHSSMQLLNNLEEGQNESDKYQLEAVNSSLDENSKLGGEGSKLEESQSPRLKLNGLAKELFDLVHYGWYWGGISKEGAEEKLKNEPDGAFIVRDSSSTVHILSLSFNCNGKTKHTRIDYSRGKFSFVGTEGEAFSSVALLIEHWRRSENVDLYCFKPSHSTSSSASAPPPIRIKLNKPISRFTEVRSLQFLSSFVLYQYTRLDLIPKLPLPPQLINFISHQKYF